VFHHGGCLSPAPVSGLHGRSLCISDFCMTGESREFLSSPVQLIKKHSSWCRLVGNVSRLFSNASREQTSQKK